MSKPVPGAKKRGRPGEPTPPKQPPRKKADSMDTECSGCVVLRADLEALQERLTAECAEREALQERLTVEQEEREAAETGLRAQLSEQAAKLRDQAAKLREREAAETGLRTQLSEQAAVQAAALRELDDRLRRERDAEFARVKLRDWVGMTLRRLERKLTAGDMAWADVQTATRDLIPRTEDDEDDGPLVPTLADVDRVQRELAAVEGFRPFLGRLADVKAAMVRAVARAGGDGARNPLAALVDFYAAECRTHHPGGGRIPPRAEFVETARQAGLSPGFADMCLAAWLFR